VKRIAPAGWGLVALGAIGCEPETLVLARRVESAVSVTAASTGVGAGGAASVAASSSVATTSTSAGVGGGGGASSSSCSDASPCENGDFCAKPTCDAPLGACEPRPTICGATAEPVCGCDGVNYYNDCLRRASGVAASTEGECTKDGLSCDASMPCPTGAFCAILLPGAVPKCDRNKNGACWVIPADCGDSPAGDRFDACDSSVTCVDACEAIKSEMPYRRVKDCTP
jgi:hypothetical protein